MPRESEQPRNPEPGRESLAASAYSRSPQAKRARAAAERWLKMTPQERYEDAREQERHALRWI